MKITWPVRYSQFPVGYMLNSAWLKPDGTYTMAIARALPGMTYYVVADSDGPVRSALLATNEKQCRPFPNDLRDGRIVYQVFEADSTGILREYGGGALVANVNDLQPRAYLRFYDRTARGYLVGLPGVIEGSSSPTNVLILHDWADPSKILMTWSAAQDQGLQEVPETFSGNALFWEAVADPFAKLKVWTPDSGVLELVSRLVSSHPIERSGLG
jgi:hypothetical protein